MNTPVSFEIAKLLKEKGFDKQTKKYYVQVFENTFKLTHHKMWEMDEESGFQNTPHYPAPTISEVVMWLYEKHEIWIEIDLIDNSRGYYFNYVIITSKDRDFNDEECFDSAKRIYDEDKHNSPTEAYKDAISHCLNELI